MLDVEACRYQRFISDLAGVNPRRAAAQLRNWLANVSRRDLPGERNVVDLLDRWNGDRPALAERLGFDSNGVRYFDLTKTIAAWLVKRRPVH